MKKEPAPKNFDWRPLPKWVSLIGGPECGALYEVEELKAEIKVKGYTEWYALEGLSPEGIKMLAPAEPHDRIHTYKRGCAYVGRQGKMRVLIMEYRHAKSEAV